MKIYVGNLSYQMTEDELKGEFEKFGTVESVILISDRETGRAKGFGFVEMTNAAEAKEAISQLDGQELSGRRVRVNEAKPRVERPRPAYN